MKLTKREKFLIQILTAVLVLYAYLQWIIIPQIDEFSKLEIEEKQYKLNTTKRELLLTSREEIEREYLALDYSIKSITSKFFSTLDQEFIIILLDELLEDLSLDIPEFFYIPIQSEELNGEKIDVLTVSFPFKGTYSSLVQFLNRLGKYEHKIIVKNINISIDEELNLIGDITLGFYSLH